MLSVNSARRHNLSNLNKLGALTGLQIIRFG